VTVNRTMPVRYLIISLERWPAFLTFLFPCPDNSLAYIVTPGFNGINSFSCILRLFGREHRFPKHESRIRMLAPDPM
jgi:hypothetical protein